MLSATGSLRLRAAGAATGRRAVAAAGPIAVAVAAAAVASGCNRHGGDDGDSFGHCPTSLDQAIRGTPSRKG